MLRLIPVIAEPIAITTITPIATPRMVSAARTLLERSESSAMPAPSTSRNSRVTVRPALIRPSARRWGRVERRGSPGRRRRRCRRSPRARRRGRPTRAQPRPAAGVSAFTTNASASPRPMPITAPAAERVADSTTNCARMSRRRAPSAFRMPISRVRSLTAMSMMFMITMPPTTSEIATSPGSARNRTREILSQVPSAPSAVWRWKLFSWPGFSCRRLRIAASASPMASCMWTGSEVWTMRASRMLIGQMSRRPGALKGMTANLSSERPNSVPCGATTPMTR